MPDLPDYQLLANEVLLNVLKDYERADPQGREKLRSWILGMEGTFPLWTRILDLKRPHLRQTLLLTLSQMDQGKKLEQILRTAYETTSH